jgi:hypothetical protein
MPRYYFDMREGDEIAPDDEGMEHDASRARGSRPLACRHGKGCDPAQPERRRAPNVDRCSRRCWASVAGEVHVRGGPA